MRLATNNMAAPSALTVAKNSIPAGAGKATILASIVSVWDIQSCNLSEYILALSYQRIAGSKLRNRLMSGTITVSGVTYAVIYHRTTPERCFQSASVRCSYRQTVFGNFVLVQPVLVEYPSPTLN